LQARAVGDELVVGLVPDREILRCKGPPVQNEEERKIMVEAVKWVGEVITGENTASSLHMLKLMCIIKMRMSSAETVKSMQAALMTHAEECMSHRRLLIMYYRHWRF